MLYSLFFLSLSLSLSLSLPICIPSFPSPPFQGATPSPGFITETYNPGTGRAGRYNPLPDLTNDLFEIIKQVSTTSTPQHALLIKVPHFIPVHPKQSPNPQTCYGIAPGEKAKP